MRLVNWNVQWATPRSPRGPELLRRIGQYSPEIVCLTETDAALLPPEGCAEYPAGYSISARPDYGYGRRGGRRKALLWSRQPWEQVDDWGGDGLPPGRFIAGVTATSLGRLRVIGVAIPWSHSRVRSAAGGRGAAEPRRAWQDHQQYLEGLHQALRMFPARRLVVVGDFNQRIGQRIGQRPGEPNAVPHHLRRALLEALPPGLTIVTASLEYRGRRTIDHIVLSDDLAAAALEPISNAYGNPGAERQLSDHYGIAANLSLAAP